MDTDAHGSDGVLFGEGATICGDPVGEGGFVNLAGG